MLGLAHLIESGIDKLARKKVERDERAARDPEAWISEIRRPEGQSVPRSYADDVE